MNSKRNRIRVSLDEVVNLVPSEYHSANFDKYKTKIPLKRWFIERYIEYLIYLVERESPTSILSIGCGEGVILYYIQKFNKDIKIVGIDLDSDALDIARIIVKGEFKVVDARKLPMGNSSFDVTICASVFEHIKDGHKQIVSEMTRVSKRSIVTTPHPLLFRLSRLFVFKNLSTLGREPDHVKEFGEKEFRCILPENSVLERRSFWYVAEF